MHSKYCSAPQDASPMQRSQDSWRLLRWLPPPVRWVLVLPIAVVSYGIGVLLSGLLAYVNLVFDPDMGSLPLWFIELLAISMGTYLSILTGSKMAPAHRLATSKVLAVALVSYFTCSAIAFERDRPAGFLIGREVVIILASIITYASIREKEDEVKPGNQN